MAGNIDNYQKVIEQIEDYAILVLDRDGTIRDWNRGAEKLKGYKANEIVGKNFKVFYIKEDCLNNLPGKLIETAALKGKATDEGWRVRKDGSMFWAGILITALYNANHQLTGFLKITRDLTERKSAEEKLLLLNTNLEQDVKQRTVELQSKVKELSDYKFALDESAIVAVTDQKGIIKHVNQNFCNISKYSEAELIGRDHRIINSGFHPKGFIKDLWVTIANGNIWKGELKNRAKDGSIYWVNTTIVPFLNKEDKPYQYLAIRSDITQRKIAEEKLLKANRLYAFISAINQSIVHIGDRCELLNRACKIAREIGQFKMAWIGLLDESNKLNMVSLCADDAAATDFIKYSGMNYSSALLRGTPTGRALATGTYAISNDVLADPAMAPWKDEYIKHGIRANISLPLKKEDRVIGIFAFHSAVEDFFDSQEVDLLLEATGDISFALEVMEKREQHKLAEARILLNEARLEKAQSIAHIGHWELDFSTGISEWSEEACRIYGLDPADNVHSFEEWTSFVHPDDYNFVTTQIKNQRETLSKSAFNYRILRKDGAIRHIHSESKFEFDASGKSIGLYGIVHDITEQKMAEEYLRRNESQLKDAQAIARVGSWEIDLLTNSLLWSDEQYAILGFKRGEVAPSTGLFLSMVHPDDIQDINQRFQHTFQTFEDSSNSFKLLMADGTVKYVYCEWKFEFDKGNSPVRMYGIIQDVTQSKKAEEEIKLLNENLEVRVKERTAELVAANKQLESFSYTVSHDLKNPLQIINGYASILGTKYKDVIDDNAQKLLTKIMRNTKHMANIMDDLLSFSKLGSASINAQMFEMTDMVQIVVEELRAADKDFNTEIIIHPMQAACADMRLMHQAILNLLSNAVKYSKKQANPVVEIGMDEACGEGVYYVKDNGVGFDMQYAGKLFQVFQRLHSASDFEGTGVGLALVNSIITKHGGKIWAESKEGEGAIFRFSLPTTFIPENVNTREATKATITRQV